MRRLFHDALKTRLIGDLAKDLTGDDVEALEAALIKA